MSGTTPNLALPYPTSTDTADVPRDIKALADRIDVLTGPAGIGMTGEIRMWPAVNPPTGWLVCNGQVVSAATYPGLATVLGQAGGNVTLPDYRDTFPVGASATNAVGARGGAANVSLTAAQSGMPAHNHTGLTAGRDRVQTHSHGAGGVWMLTGINGFVTPAAGAGMGGAGLSIDPSDPPDHFHTVKDEPARNATQAHENRPPFQAINFIIRAG
jgi:microcystin-dependent protein